ncbi:MAG: ABC transporter ATP-binding protein [Ignavibacteriales bacterium]
MQIVKKLTAIFEPRERVQAGLLLILLLMGVFFDVIGVTAILPFINILNDPNVMDKYPILQQVYTGLHLTNYMQFIMVACTALLLIFLVKNVFLFFITYAQYRFIFNKQVALGTRLLKTYMDQPYTFHLARNTAELLRNINIGVPTVIGQIMINLFSFLSEALVIICILVILAVVDPLSTLSITVFIGGSTYLVYHKVKQQLDKYGKLKPVYDTEMIKWVNQGLGSIKETKVLGREEFFTNRYCQEGVKSAQASLLSQVASAFPRFFIETITVFGMLLIIAINIWQGKTLASIISILGLFTMAAFRMMPSMTRIFSAMSSMRFAIPVLEYIYDDVILERSYKQKMNNQTAGTEFKDFTDITISDLSFRYPETDELVLKNIKMKIKRGTSIAVIGPSGAGKTTLIDILLGLLHPDKGDIKVGGKSIYQNLGAWQQQIGYIPQNIYLLDDTIRRNITLGVPDPQIDEDRVLYCIKVAQIDTFVNDLPEKLDTLVGELGVRLSGGQRQRIGIARAIYHDPAILVMDEATSALDNETERYVTDAIEQLGKEKTIIVIAHRLTTIEKCDVRYTIEDGQIVEIAKIVS